MTKYLIRNQDLPEGLDSSEILYKVSGILQAPVGCMGILGIIKDPSEFLGISKIDSERILRDSKGFMEFPGDSSDILRES